MPTYRFPEAVKAGNIPFSQGREYKPTIGIGRLVAKESVRVKTANTLVRTLGASDAMTMSRSSLGLSRSSSTPALVLPVWNKNFKDHVPSRREVLAEKKLKAKHFTGPLGNSGTKWTKPVPYEKPVPEVNVAERSLKAAVKKKTLGRSKSTLTMGDAKNVGLPEYLSAKDIDSYFQAKKEVQRLRRMLSRDILGKQKKKSNTRLDWNSITVKTASRTIHAGIGH